jgi:hypothetical protein
MVSMPLPSTRRISADDRVMAKELVDYFAQQQITIHYGYARALIAACPHSIRGRYVLARDAWTWWSLHPEFKPFGLAGLLAGSGPKGRNS